MNRLIFLDAGLLGLLSMPTPTSLSTRCREWANNLLSTSDVLVVPEIADYKVRRELLRADRARSYSDWMRSKPNCYIKRSPQRRYCERHHCGRMRANRGVRPRRIKRWMVM